MAFADAGVPMLALIIPGFAVSIIPIIIIEYFYLKRKLALTAAHARTASITSNLVSTLIGIPLTWLILVVIQMFTGGGRAYGIDTLIGRIIAVTWQAPWLIPYESDLGWMIPAAGIVLLVPFFFVSCWIEYIISRRVLRESDAKAVKIAVRGANLLTYGLMSLCLFIWLFKSVFQLMFSSSR
jgi:hypothetical protein